MVAVAKWLTHRIVIPTYVGSIPISHPISFFTYYLPSSELSRSCLIFNVSSYLNP